MSRRIGVFLVLGALLCGCQEEGRRPFVKPARKAATTVPTVPRPIEASRGKTRLAEEDDIREALLRDLLNLPEAPQALARARRAGGTKWNNTFVAITINGERADPSDELLKRFAGSPRPLRKLSESHGFSGSIVRDVATGQGGVVFYVGEIEWITDEEVKTAYGHYRHLLGGSRQTCRLRKLDGRWVIDPSWGVQYVY